MLNDPTISNPKSRPLAWSAALLGATVLAACLGLGEDEDKKTVDVRYKGALSTLDSIPDTTSNVNRWHLVVDAAEPHQLRGQCNFTAWLGDSAGVEEENTDSLYTNTQMGNRTLSATKLRQDGIDFYRYPQDTTHGPLTHYRVDFSCEY